MFKDVGSGDSQSALTREIRSSLPKHPRGQLQGYTQPMLTLLFGEI